MKKLKNLTPEENKGLLGRTLIDFLYFYGKNFNYLNYVITPGLKQLYPYNISVIFFY